MPHALHDMAIGREPRRHQRLARLCHMLKRHHRVLIAMHHQHRRLDQRLCRQPLRIDQPARNRTPPPPSPQRAAVRPANSSSRPAKTRPKPDPHRSTPPPPAADRETRSASAATPSTRPQPLPRLIRQTAGSGTTESQTARPAPGPAHPGPQRPCRADAAPARRRCPEGPPHSRHSRAGTPPATVALPEAAAFCPNCKSCITEPLPVSSPPGNRPKGSAPQPPATGSTPRPSRETPAHGAARAGRTTAAPPLASARSPGANTSARPSANIA